MSIKLQPGDYVDMLGREDEYDEVVSSIASQGYNDDCAYPMKRYIFLSNEMKDIDGCDTYRKDLMHRKLTVDQILDIEPTLPTIGSKWIECEDGDIVEVVAHHRDAIVCWSEDEGYRSYDVSELKPITEIGQLEADLSPYSYTPKEVAEHLWNLGYRKQ